MIRNVRHDEYSLSTLPIQMENWVISLINYNILLQQNKIL